MHMSANYRTVYKLIQFIFGMFVYLYVFFILLKFHINIINRSKVIVIFAFHYQGGQLAVQACHALWGRGGRSPRLGLPVCESK